MAVIYHNSSVDFLIKKAIERKEARETKYGTLVTYTGKYTGRSPNDKYIVDSFDVHQEIDWGKNNLPLSEASFKKLKDKVQKFFQKADEYFVVDAFVGADKKYQVSLRLYSETASIALFALHQFRRPKKADLRNFRPELIIYSAPSVLAEPQVDGTNSEAFIILNFKEKTILIGATRYAGEVKKSVFTYMNYLLPKKGVLPMHCGANFDPKTKTTALFFGLSGTGKTTLSSDPERFLIGDDEHGWSNEGVFNFEGGCYAKCIRIKKESEPQIWQAIHRRGTLVENVIVKDNGEFDFFDDSITENTRAVYPLEFVDNAIIHGKGSHPKYVLFLTADATGVLPPLAQLNLNQAAYHFLSGYTSKLAGTERGIKEPKPTFSAYFGAPFMPHKPMVYLNLLRHYLKKYNTKTYLVNTGWIGGGYGVGERISIKETRKIVSAILSGNLDKVACRYDPIFNLFVPYKVPGVDARILDPTILWQDKGDYLIAAKKLANLFLENMKRFSGVEKEILESGPKI
ncbi:MAG: phosphoenolpyruvate carboxykinase (ATP) [Patescibacteria group bacterium]|nr:phosphoenolpyruvate carboxykinase (ATP) [Patescibacteria group bacterium]